MHSYMLQVFVRDFMRPSTKSKKSAIKQQVTHRTSRKKQCDAAVVHQTEECRSVLHSMPVHLSEVK